MIGSYQHALVSTSIHNDDSYVMCSMLSSAQMIPTWHSFALNFLIFTYQLQQEIKKKYLRLMNVYDASNEGHLVKNIK